MGHEFRGQDPTLPPGVTQKMIDDLCMSDEEVEREELERLRDCQSFEVTEDIIIPAGTRVVVWNPDSGEYLPVTNFVPLLERLPRILTVVTGEL